MRRGLALLVTIGVLGVLAVLGTTFTILARLERRASNQRVLQTRAFLLARSGLEDATARLSTGQDPTTPETAYGGENWDASPDGRLSPLEASQQVFRRTAAGTAADIETCPIEHAMRPSFFIRQASLGTLPALSITDGRNRGTSGGTGPDGNYSLQVEDESAKINVNGGILDAQDRDGDAVPDHRDADVRVVTDPQDAGCGWNGQLYRILNLLGTQPEVAVANLGARVLADRPRGGYASIPDLQKTLGIPKDLSPWLTVSSGSDPGVVHPNGLAAPGYSGSLSDLKRARRALRLEEEGRPPVNLNAAPRAVLVALLGGLAGLCEYDEIIPLSYGIGDGTPIANAMIARRRTNRFDSWGEFSSFCDGLVASGILSGMNLGPNYACHGGSNLAGADLLKANFDPNTRLNKQLPDRLLYRWIDKSDLTAWSTEGSLGPTGSFRLRSLGRLLDPSGRILARASLTTTIEVFSLLRQSSQKDFVSGRTNPRDYLSTAADPLARTTGASAAWGNSGRGLAAMTYPCAPMALPEQAADFDGGIALATVEMEPATPAGGPGTSLRFLQHFDKDWDSEPLGHPSARIPGTLAAADASLQSDLEVSVWPGPAEEASTLYPDGAHAQKGRSPCYPAAGNLASYPVSGGTGNRAVFCYWVKPLLYSEAEERFVMDFGCLRRDGGSQYWCCGRPGIGPLGMMVENTAHPIAEEGSERKFLAMVPDGRRIPGLRWQLVTVLVDTGDADIADHYDLSVWVRGFVPGVVLDPIADYPTALVPSWGEDLAVPGALLILGNNLSGSDETGMDANQVLDEFAICDFGPGSSQGILSAKQWASRRWTDGRYYKGTDGGSFLSGILTAPGRLLSVDWTCCLPRESPPDLDLDMGNSQRSDRGVPGYVDPRLDNGRVSVDLVPSGGDLATPAFQALRQGGRIDRTLNTFRYRVRLESGVQDLLTAPALESPYFDDITFAWQSLYGPRVTAWGRE